MPHRSIADLRSASGAAAATALLAVLVPGQFNAVQRRNTVYVQTETPGHPNGNPFADSRVNPPEHREPGDAVPAGTRSYVWVPRAASLRSGDEPVDGFVLPLSPSSATTTYPAFLYRPAVAAHPSRAAPAGHREPDPSQPPFWEVAEAPLVFPQFGFYEAGVTLAQALPVPETEPELVLSMRWAGGDNRWAPDTLQHWGDAQEGPYSAAVFGFVAPAGAVTAVAMPAAPRSQLALTHLRAEPGIDVRSDWGRSYAPPSGFPGLLGSGIATYEAPLATMAGQLAWDVRGGPAYAGTVAVPMLNVGPIATTATPFLGLTLELDPLDPALGVLAGAGYVLLLDPTGTARGPLLPVPALGTAALGTAIGAEWLLVDGAFTSLLGSSQAAWVVVAR